MHYQLIYQYLLKHAAGQEAVRVIITWLHPGGGWVITEKNSTDRFSPLGRNGVVESEFGPAKGVGVGGKSTLSV